MPDTENWILFALLAFLYLIALISSLTMVVLLLKQRDRDIIRERSFPLLLMSCLSNLIGMSSTAINGLAGGNSHASRWVFLYVGQFLEYMFFAPYLLRMYYIKVSYFDFLQSEERYWRREHRLHFRWYAKALAIGVVPFLSVAVLVGLIYLSDEHHFSDDSLKLMFMAWEWIYFLEVMTLLSCVFYLRHQEDRFGITKELKAICAVTFVMSLADNYSYHEEIFIVQVFRDLVILVVSNLIPVIRSYKVKSVIFLTVDVCSSFEKSIMEGVEECLIAFSEYLETIELDSDRYTIDSKTSAGEFVTASSFINFYTGLMDLEFHPSLSKAESLKKNFFRVHPRPFPRAISEGVSSKLLEWKQSGRKSDLPSVFEEAKQYALTKMQQDYFPRYLASERFRKLATETEKLLRFKNRQSLRGQH